MSTVEPIDQYTFPTGDCGLATLSVRVDDLAARLGFSVLTWDEDGLGPMRGFGCRLPSGRIFVLEESVFSVQYNGAVGPLVLVDARELATLGISALLTELLQALGLNQRDVADTADARSVQEAIDLLNRFDSRSLKKSPVNEMLET